MCRARLSASLKSVRPSSSSLRVRCRSGTQLRIAKIRYFCRLHATLVRVRSFPALSSPEDAPPPLAPHIALLTCNGSVQRRTPPSWQRANLQNEQKQEASTDNWWNSSSCGGARGLRTSSLGAQLPHHLQEVGPVQPLQVLVGCPAGHLHACRPSPSSTIAAADPALAGCATIAHLGGGLGLIGHPPQLPHQLQVRVRLLPLAGSHLPAR